MKQRVITAIVALAIFIPILIFGGIYIDIAAAALTCVGIFEIYIIRKRIIVSPDFMITLLGAVLIALPTSFFTTIFTDVLTLNNFIYICLMLLMLIMVFSKNKFSFEDVGVSAISMIYIGTGFHYLAAIRNTAGLELLMYALLIVWITDSGAYMVGRKLGKHKLFPYISPNKTWEGSIGGTFVAVIIALVYSVFFLPEYNLIYMTFVALILSIAGQLGDLIESAYKRYYRVKDSGNILPGHGGILDRFDSMLIVLPLLHIFGLI